VSQFLALACEGSEFDSATNVSDALAIDLMTASP